MAIIAIIACGFVVFILVMKASFHVLSLVQKGVNDDAFATDIFCGLLKQMKREIIIHDDGEEQSFYDDPEVVKLIRTKLAEGCQVRCLFNKQVPSLCLVELVNEFPDKLEIRYTPDWFVREQPDVHYKIVDRGSMAYISRHRNDGKRDFEFFNCSWYPPFIRSWMFVRQTVEFRQLMKVASRKMTIDNAKDNAKEVLN